ncbi:uncharacterized protein LOC124115525 [Haliotis rufescens]|uniref:uncharacterized protein LOC124115525 n=1 Tax=Haliotis rufescens TaxID=6454 RepID=UPI001EB05512|nr:uncharacterized protein LOC124115525 [Haliotis rufescens]
MFCVSASSDPSRTERRPVTTKKPATQASSDPSWTEGTPVATTKKPATQATPSPADCCRLINASRRGKLEEVKRLLSLGVDVNCRERQSKAPVMIAAWDTEAWWSSW